MNVYVETNFVFELVYEQEQHESCKYILDLAETGQIQLFLPAYCLAEPNEKMVRQTKSRKALQEKLNLELQQLARTATYKPKMKDIHILGDFLIDRGEWEYQQFQKVRERLLNFAIIIPLDRKLLELAAQHEADEDYEFSPQDAIVFASVLSHIQQNSCGNKLFLNKNIKDFDSPAVKKVLSGLGCKFIPDFDKAVSYIKSMLKNEI